MPSEKAVRTPARVRVSPDGLTPKQISEMLLAYEGISKIMDAVRERAVVLVHSGVDIPGYEATFSSARRMWMDPAKAEKHLKKLGLKDPYAPQELLSPAQAEKALRAAGKWPKRPRGSAAEDFVDPLKPVLGYTDTKPSISRVVVK
jgi:hypothetical protein